MDSQRSNKAFLPCDGVVEALFVSCLAKERGRRTDSKCSNRAFLPCNGVAGVLFVSCLARKRGRRMGSQCSNRVFLPCDGVVEVLFVSCLARKRGRRMDSKRSNRAFLPCCGVGEEALFFVFSAQGCTIGRNAPRGNIATSSTCSGIRVVPTPGATKTWPRPPPKTTLPGNLLFSCIQHAHTVECLLCL